MSARLKLALENGRVAMPDGEVAVLEPVIGTDLSGFDRAATTILSRSARVREAFQRADWRVQDDGSHFEAAFVILPRAKDAQRALIKDARRRTAGPIVVDGDKTNGIDAIYRELRKRADVSEAWSKAHGKVFSIIGGEFDDWPDQAPARGDDGWWRAPGVFSADGIDKASALLAESLPGTLAGSVVDLGAGWGYLSCAVLKRDGVTDVSLVEDDMLALEAARLNVTDSRATFVAADALAWRPERSVDHVVTNPPFHQGRAADPELGREFIRAASAMLVPRGRLWLVANRQLPYEGALRDAFRTVDPLVETPSFKVFHAQSPKKPTR